MSYLASGLGNRAGVRPVAQKPAMCARREGASQLLQAGVVGRATCTQGRRRLTGNTFRSGQVVTGGLSSASQSLQEAAGRMRGQALSLLSLKHRITCTGGCLSALALGEAPEHPGLILGQEMSIPWRDIWTRTILKCPQAD